MNPDKRLIDELRNGSYKAFTQLYEAYSPRLYGFVYEVLKSRSGTSDLIQETFLRLWETRERINSDQSFKSYLFTIASNLMVSEYRKQMSRPQLMEYIEFLHHSNLSENTTQQQIDLDEFLLRLERAKQQLTPRQREIFVLVKECGMSSQQVAQQLSISDQVVRNQLSTAMKILKIEMADYLSLFLLLFVYH